MFQEIIENKLQIKDLPTYQKYKEETAQKILTQEEIDQLSPDRINSKEFWKWIDEHREFKNDTISFGATKEVSIKEINKRNKQIAVFNACDMYYDNWASRGLAIRVLEIGPGFGCFKNKCDGNKNVRYWGVDCYPKIDGVLELEDGDTKLPRNIMDEVPFQLVYSCNVFQHLSVRQRHSYYRQIQNVLQMNGVFSFTTMSFDERKDVGFKSSTKKYTCHYGQFTELQSLKEYIEDLEKYFDILFYSHRPFEVTATFHCVPKQMYPQLIDQLPPKEMK